MSNQGWECPKCGNILSPVTPYCIFCSKVNNKVESEVEEPKLITHNITQKVNVRKYPVDTEKLTDVLRKGKEEVKLSNKKIAEKLEVPQTQVDHYFRTDSSNAIPEPEIWPQIKELLNIKTDEFDKSITTFEEKDGVYEKSNRVYDEEGIAPTLTQQTEKVLEHNKLPGAYGRNFGSKGKLQDLEDSCDTLQAAMGNGGGNVPIIEDKDIDNPLKGVSGKSWQFEQNVYSEDSKCTRAVKAGGGSGNIPKVMTIGNYMPSGHDASRIVDSEGITPTVKENHGTVTATNTSDFRIRKLTPKECWRLMGFDDEDFERAQKVNSNTQLYKQAGNSIVVNVLEEIFKSLLL